MPDVHLSVFRGTPATKGIFADFDVPAEEGMVVLDALHWIQAHEAPDLAVRWNCKAAKCGSCSAEVNGRPSLTCKTRLSDFDEGETITVEPMRAFPLVRDLVTDVSWNYEVNKTSRRSSRLPTSRRKAGGGSRRTSSGSRSSASASSASSARTSATSCATTRRSSHSWARASSSGAPASRCTRSTPRTGPSHLKDEGGIGLCNITKCCTEVCPEHIKITDNAIIPLKERVADKYYDPIQMVWRRIRGDRGERRRSPIPGRSVAAGLLAPSVQLRVRGARLNVRRPLRIPAPTETRTERCPTPTPSRPSGLAVRDRPDDALRLIIRTDGAARGNPGPASAGAVLIDASRAGCA